MPPSVRRLSVHGFTLTELLVVMAIAGILAALAVPVIGKTRDAASATTCLKNLRNAHNWLTLYAGEHNGRFPAPLGPNLDTPNNPDNLSWWSVLQLYFNSGSIPPTVGQKNSSQNPWYCQAAEKTFPKGVRRAYAINADGGLRELYFMPSQNRKWSQTLLIADGAFNAGDPTDSLAYFRSAAQTPGLVLDPRHKGKVSGIFLDGHAETFALNDPQLETWVKNLRN